MLNLLLKTAAIGLLFFAVHVPVILLMYLLGVA